MAAISVDALAPSMTVTPGNAVRTRSALFTTPTCETLNCLACAMTSSGLLPADEIATTLKREGLLAITSRA